MAQEEKIHKLLDSGLMPWPVGQGPRKKSETKTWEVRGMSVGGYVGVNRKCEDIFKVTCSCPSTRKSIHHASTSMSLASNGDQC